MKTDKEIMKPNIEQDIQPQVQKLNLQDQVANLTIRERLINGRIAKGSSNFILPITKTSVKYSNYLQLLC